MFTYGKTSVKDKDIRCIEGASVVRINIKLTVRSAIMEQGMWVSVQMISFRWDVVHFLKSSFCVCLWS